MSIIEEKLANPSDIKNLNKEELNNLSKEVREAIIDTVSKNGGHLSSNLGVVELTIALLRQFDFCKDKIVWDVGHQTYTYKILTGRYEKFCSLRTKDGLSGFPKRCESKFDFFNTGHSSTSISAALGMVRANNLKGITNNVVAVIGDGALTGGMAFEALNDAGQSGLDLIVILNDNQMSINKNVGGLAKHLESIRVSKRYILLKKSAFNVLNKTKVGKCLAYILENLKTILRSFIRPSKVIFEDLGFKYYGPIDGHDIADIERHLSSAKKIKGPVLIHVLTQKGKGYEFAEVSPEKYHGVAPFEIANGIYKSPENKSAEKYSSFSNAFGEFLIEFASKDSSITAICAAMVSGTGLEKFQVKYPKRIFDVGIAEQHAITMAGGMATEQLKPVVALYSTFLQRGYDQILHDVALQNLHVVFCIDRAGIVGEDGETHQGIYDISLLNTIPSIEILSPRNYNELYNMLKYALYTCKGPVAIRYPRGSQKKIAEEYEIVDYDFTSPLPVLLSKGIDISIITEGIMYEKGINVTIELEKLGYSCDLIDIRRIKPLDNDFLLNSISKTNKVITIENALSHGGLGSSVESLILENNLSASIRKIGVKDHPLQHGKVDELYALEEMDESSILRIAKAMLSGKQEMSKNI